MRLVRTGIVSVVAVLSLLTATAAMADIPLTNPNVNPATLTCVRGSQTITFTAVGIAQSAAIAGQIVNGVGVVVFTRLVIDGQLVFSVPGQAGRSDIWSCTVAGDPGVLLEVFLTPRR